MLYFSTILITVAHRGFRFLKKSKTQPSDSTKEMPTTLFRFTHLLSCRCNSSNKVGSNFLKEWHLA